MCSQNETQKNQIHTLGVDIGGVLVVDHVVQVGDLALGIGDDGELEVGAGDLVDVLDPGVVGLGAVGTQTDQLDTASSELGLELSKGTKLGGTDGGEVILFQRPHWLVTGVLAI